MVTLYIVTYSYEHIKLLWCIVALQVVYCFFLYSISTVLPQSGRMWLKITDLDHSLPAVKSIPFPSMKKTPNWMKGLHVHVCVFACKYNIYTRGCIWLYVHAWVQCSTRTYNVKVHVEVTYHMWHCLCSYCTPRSWCTYSTVWSNGFNLARVWYFTPLESMIHST